MYNINCKMYDTEGSSQSCAGGGSWPAELVSCNHKYINFILYVFKSKLIF